ncbi:hypothetical protein SNEBB_002037 [Seison nebaliae]|nr:hypothetical protein SNEBB_002037 [Seison nebaliae]
MKTLFLVLSLVVTFTSALYTSGDVVELTASNFASLVLGDDSVWLIKFYAPWCGHCKNLVPEFNKAAKALKGIVKLGAVNMDEHQSAGAPYGIQGFPTLKIFGLNKNSPTDYNGARSASSMVDTLLGEASKVAKARLSGSSGSSGNSNQNNYKKSSSASDDDVVTLTDQNFEELVYNSDKMWLVEMYAPWCGHCKALAPEWAAAATQLKGKVNLGALDATVQTVIAGRYGIRGYPTIKVFQPGAKGPEDAQDFEGGRTTNDIVNWAMEKAVIPPPSVDQLKDNDMLNKKCESQICIFAFLPHLLDCQSACRNEYISLLITMANKYKRFDWGYMWTEGAHNEELEKSFEIGGFGYPAVAAVNLRKGKFVLMKGSFSENGLNEFFRELSMGRGSSMNIVSGKLPQIPEQVLWDGKDGEMPIVEDLDLSDVFDDDEKAEL